MPTKKAATKALKQSEKAATRNRRFKIDIKKAVKTAKLALSEKNQDAQSSVTMAIKKIDRAGAKGIIKKNKAARLKSRLMKRARTATA